MHLHANILPGNLTPVKQHSRRFKLKNISSIKTNCANMIFSRRFKPKNILKHSATVNDGGAVF
jgi:hypothetical protein